MANEYVTRVLLEVQGQSIEDFSSVTEGEVEHRKAVKLMNKYGVVGVVPQYPLKIDYVVPSDGPEFNFEEIEDGTLTIDKDNGVRIEYSGVYCLKVGEAKYDGDKEAVRTIELLALRRS